VLYNKVSQKGDTFMILYPDYMPAYTISNEDQRWATRAVSNAKHVLTVAGSGDQALFYKLSGATIVDTFDITPNAGAIQDIKYVAIKNISRTEYKNLLVNLYGSRNVLSVPQMQDLEPLLTKKSRATIKRNNKIGMFSAGLDANEYPENIPTDEEYENLRTILTKPFNFIQCGLDELSFKLYRKYDLINLSNIFDYCYDRNKQIEILGQLSQYLKIGGRIVYLPQMQKFNYEDVYITENSAVQLVFETVKQSVDKKSKMILFQRRTR